LLAAFVADQNPDDPLAGLHVGEQPAPDPPAGWEVIEVRAASVNRHDIWSLHGPPPRRERLPMILGTDAAGVDGGGRAVIAYPVIGDYCGRWTLPSEEHPGTLAERVALPATALLEMPPELSFEQAACLPTAYLTAFRMLFRCGGVGPGDRVLVQGASGGLASAAILLAKAAGASVLASSRSEGGRELAESLGATSIAPGERLPSRVDAVIETVGEATWEHSLGAVRSGGRIVVAGGTSGLQVPLDLEHLYLRRLSVVGTSMGTREDLESLLSFIVAAGVRPLIDRVEPLAEARAAFAAVIEGTTRGKAVLTCV
jgi:NADPH:quinone reductase-like Zn-dependent oxidoreductase